MDQKLSAKQTQNYLSWFRDSSPYINAHRNKTMVFYLSGAFQQHPSFETLIKDLILLHTLGIKLVLVLGSKKQIDQQLHHACIENKEHNGIRITTEPVLNIAKSVIGQQLFDLQSKLSRVDSPLGQAGYRTVVTGNFVTAKPVGIKDGIDHCQTGLVRKVQVKAIQEQLALNHIILLPTLVASPIGELFNIESKELATEIAIELQADKLIIWHDNEPFIQQITGNVYSPQNFKQITPTCPLTNMAIKASERGVKRVHLLDKEIEGALLVELFTRNGHGILVSGDSFETIRQANSDDVTGIIDLIKPLEESGVLVKRSRELIEAEIDKFTVITRDGLIVGCAALHTFPDDNCAEMNCLALNAGYRGENRGDKLLNTIQQKCLQQGIKRLFVLTTQSAHWFKERHFHEASLSSLPVSKQQIYNYQRNSKVLIKELSE